MLHEGNQSALVWFLLLYLLYEAMTFKEERRHFPSPAPLYIAVICPNDQQPKTCFAAQNRSKCDKSSWNQLQLLSFGQRQLCRLGCHGGEGGQEQSATSPFAHPGQAGVVAAPSPDLPQHSWAKPKELWEVFLSLINIRGFCLQGSSREYSIISL